MPKFHCNHCFRTLKLFSDRPSSDNIKSYLSECLEHIFCEHCAKRLHYNCSICKRRTRFMEIQKEMPMKFRMLFEPVQSALQIFKGVKNFQVAQDDWNFKQMAKKYENIKHYGSVLNQKLHDQHRTNESISKQNEKLKFMIEKASAVRFLAQKTTDKNRKRRPMRSPSPKSNEKEKFGFHPNQYKNVKPVSPRRLRFSRHSSFYNCGSDSGFGVNDEFNLN